MSEYQYYEFQAIDRCLTNAHMSELRAVSKRARITPNSFVNEYSYGDFKGDEDLWMEEYFDGFLYYANWGTRILKLRLPESLLDLKTAQAYCNSDHATARLSYDSVILDFMSDGCDAYSWDEQWDDGLQLSSFLSLRMDLMHGDLRCLYLGWLANLQDEECDDTQLEPPVPPGLSQLNSALINFAMLLRVDPNLIEAAAQMSPALLNPTSQSSDFRTWLGALSESEKDDVLVDVLRGSTTGDRTASLMLLQRFNQAQSQQRPGKTNSGIRLRTVGELLAAAELITQENERKEVERAAAQEAEKQRLYHLAREKRLNEITGQEYQLWNRIELLASEKVAASYDKAVVLLIDLRDLAARGDQSKFLSELTALRERHSRKPAFIARLKEVDCDNALCYRLIGERQQLHAHSRAVELDGQG